MRFIKLFKKQGKPKNNWYRVTSSLEEAVEVFTMKRSQGEELVSIRLDNSVNFKK